MRNRYSRTFVAAMTLGMALAVAVFAQEQFNPDFLALNPLGKVPVLEDPRLGQPLAESGAILLWLAEREGKFLPTSQPQRAEVMQS